METTNLNDKSKPRRRRRGRLAEEIAKEANVSLYLAKQGLKLRREAPELAPFVESGELRLRQAFAIMKYAPELIAYVVDGRLPCAEVNRVIRELRELEEPELSFEEEVERSFRRWLSTWRKEDRKEVREIVDDMPLAKFVDLMPANFAVDFGLETKKRKQP